MMAESGLSDSTAHGASGEPAEATGRWVTKTVVLCGAFVLALAIVVVVGKTVFDWIEEHRENAELAKHPWWDGTVTAEDVDHIVNRIASLEADKDAERTGLPPSLLLYRSGKVQIEPCDYVKDVRGSPETHACVLMFGTSPWPEFILFLPGEAGCKRLSRREVRVLLRKMLDEAHSCPGDILGTNW